MTAPLFVLAFLLLFALWAVGMGLAWHRIDRLERTNRRLDQLLDQADSDFTEAARHARDWAALADEHAAELVTHKARCLGERITAGSERCN